MLIKILIGLAVVVIVIIVVSRFQPNTYTVARTGTIAAPPSMVYAQIIDFHNWVKFDPCIEQDSSAAFTYEGPASGVGAKYTWESKTIGTGSMTIAEVKPNEEVIMDQHTLTPMESKSKTAFKIAPDGNGTKLTWSMTGEHNFFSKIMCLFTSMDKMIGGQYEKGFERMNKAFADLSVRKP
ncbi:MAG: SRPBCC family protein [Flavobacteriales bacterium]|nr:MAG: SRPBCC family protein [Flavobacteriales bacterium]